MEKGILFSKSSGEKIKYQKSYSFVIGSSDFDNAVNSNKEVTRKQAKFYDEVMEKIIEPQI